MGVLLSSLNRHYCVVMVRKNLSVANVAWVLFDKNRHFFHITNRAGPAEQIVKRLNQRCNQENLIKQLKEGVQTSRALAAIRPAIGSTW